MDKVEPYVEYVCRGIAGPRAMRKHVQQELREHLVDAISEHEAAGSTPQFGDRRGYQMDPANSDEAVREAKLDLEEGADVVMVKPALPYLDVLRRARQATSAPLAAYQVSGEYSLIKAAAERGWIDERAAVMETLTGIRRAGADLIITYFAPEVARWLGA